ncbi:MAG: hypothetical protein AAGD11_21000 [Planctomycetota bacterium]
MSKSRSLPSWPTLLLFAGWSLALFGALQVHRFEASFGYWVCGPWGCGPPVSALVGYHAFWTLLIVPPAAILRHRRNVDRVRNVGLAALLISVSGIVALLLIDGWNNSSAEQYLLRWCLFRVATFVDIPLVQLGLVGFWLSRSPHAGVQQKSESEYAPNGGRDTTQTADV